MRKENESIKKKYTLQIQDLRRQLVTKKAFDEDESQREISRLKKELHFMQMSMQDAKRTKSHGALAGVTKQSSRVNNEFVSMSKSTTLKPGDRPDMENNGGMDSMNG